MKRSAAPDVIFALTFFPQDVFICCSFSSCGFVFVVCGGIFAVGPCCAEAFLVSVHPLGQQNSIHNPGNTSSRISDSEFFAQCGYFCQ